MLCLSLLTGVPGGFLTLGTASISINEPRERRIGDSKYKQALRYMIISKKLCNSSQVVFIRLL